MLTLHQARDLLRTSKAFYNGKLIGKMVWRKSDREVLQQALASELTSSQTKQDIAKALRLYKICLQRRRHAQHKHSSFCRQCQTPLPPIHNTVNNFYCTQCVLNHKAEVLMNNREDVTFCNLCRIKEATYGYSKGPKLRCKDCALFTMM